MAFIWWYKKIYHLKGSDNIVYSMLYVWIAFFNSCDFVDG